MKFDFIILGASGMQGKIVSRDLLEKNYRVLLTDIYREGADKIIARFPKSAGFRFLDVRRLRKMTQLIKQSGANLVINCAESDWNVNVYRSCLLARVHVVDLGSEIKVTQKQLALHSAFQKYGLTAVTGCGSTPGINNVLLNYALQSFDSVETVRVGFAWDSNIKKFVVPFSIQSIIEEFTWLAPVVENGQWLNKIPLDNVIEREFKLIGRQKCFPVEHSETFTFKHYFQERGLKNIAFYAGFPKHSAETIISLIELGFGDKEKVRVDDSKVTPLSVLTRVLTNLTPPEGYAEKENLWVEIVGEKDGERKEMLMECLVPTLPGWEEAGCNIDTGFPASIIAQMVKDGRISQRGSFAPEAVVPPEELFRELGAKSMMIYQDGAIINRESLQLPFASEKTHNKPAGREMPAERAILQLVKY